MEAKEQLLGSPLLLPPPPLPPIASSSLTAGAHLQLTSLPCPLQWRTQQQEEVEAKEHSHMLWALLATAH